MFLERINKDNIWGRTSVQLRNDDAGFTLYFWGYDHSNGEDSAEVKQKTRADREGI